MIVASLFTIKNLQILQITKFTLTGLGEVGNAHLMQLVEQCDSCNIILLSSISLSKVICPNEQPGSEII